MDFSFTDEQQLLLETTRKVLRDQYGLAERRGAMTGADGYSRELWRRFADLGLLSLNVPEEYGGLAAGPVGTLLVSMALGEALVVEPYLSSAVLATRAIGMLASAVQRGEWLPKLAAGELIAVLAHDEDPTGDTTDIDTLEATAVGDKWLLNGCKPVVYHAPQADLLLISACVAGTAAKERRLFAIARGHPGMHLESYITVDGHRAADVNFDRTEVVGRDRIGDDVTDGLSQVVDHGVAAMCAYAVGALDAALSATIEYCRTRVQFGVPIGRFQALQHRMADMLTHVEQARSMAHLAASRCESRNRVERAAALSAAKVVIGNAARFVGQQAVQLHGGMGVTDEVAISHYFKQLLAFELRFGSTRSHLERYADLM